MKHIQIFLHIPVHSSTTIFIKMNIKQPMHTFNRPLHSGVVQ